MFDREREIAEWRGRLASGGRLAEDRLSELESHLRDSMDDLAGRGLDAEEAFLVATRRVGNLDAVAGEFARAGSAGEWRRIALVSAPGGARARGLDIAVAAGFALAAGLLAKLPALFGVSLDADDNALVWLRNAGLFCLPAAAGSLAWSRAREAARAGGMPGGEGGGDVSSPWLRAAVLALLSLGLAFYVNLFPWKAGSQTELLSSIHLPFFLWISLLPLYAGKDWREPGRGMDFVRFTGESFIYAVLIFCGVVVLQAVTMLVFSSAGIDARAGTRDWILVVGAFATPVAALRLALAKRAVVETMAPVLARIFGPLFLLAMIAFLVISAVSGRNPLEGSDSLTAFARPLGSRDALIAFDLLLAVVFALVLFSSAMRDPRASPGPVDVLDLALAVAGLAVDALLLAAMLGRIGTWGASPNRIAALGENLILFVALAGAAFILARHLAGRGSYATLLRWQTAIVGVIFAWTGIVALVFPLVFGGG